MDTIRETRVSNLKTYLNNLQSKGSLTQKDVELVNKIWEQLDNSFEKNLAVPDIALGEQEKVVFLIWREPSPHYLEFEIHLQESIEVFYHNRNTGNLWEWKTTIQFYFSISENQDLRKFLNFFIVTPFIDVSPF